MGVFLNKTSKESYLLTLILFVGLLSWSIGNHYPPWIGFHNEVAAFVWALLIACYFMSCELKRGLNSYTGTTIDLVVAVMLATIVLQSYSGLVIYFDKSIVGILYILTAYCINLACRTSSFATAGLERIMNLTTWGFVAAGVLTSYVILYQLFSLDYLHNLVIDHPVGDRAFGNLGQANHAATLLVISLISTVICYERRFIHITGLLVISTLILLCIILTASRVALLSLVLLIVWWAVCRKKASLRLTFAPLVGGVTLYVCLQLLVPTLREISDGGSARVMVVTATESVRATMFFQAIAAIKNQWQAGYGFLQASDSQSAGILLGIVGENHRENFTYTHNLFLDLLVWFGVPVGISVSFLLSRSILKILTSINTSYQWGLVACMCPIVTHCFTEFPYAYGYFLFPLMFWYSLLEASNSVLKVKCDRNKRVTVVNMALITLVLFLIIFGALIVYEYLRLEEDHRTARFNVARIGSTPLNYAPFQPLILKHLADLNAAAFVDTDQAVSSADTLMLKNLSTVYPDFWVQARYIRALLQNDDHHNAVRQLSILRGKIQKTYFDAFVNDLARNKLCEASEALPVWIKACGK